MTTIKATITIFISLLFLSACDNGRQDALEPSKTLYENVIDSGKIRVGYIPYPPSLIKDPNTKELSGIFHDVLKLIGENLELEIEYVEELSWGTMIESVNSGRVDMVNTGLWPNAARGKHVDFTIPLYFSPIFSYGRSDETRFASGLKVLDSTIKIAVIDGEMSSTIADKDFIEAKKIRLTQTSDVSQMLLEVTSGKADLTFVEPAIAEAFIRANPNSIKKLGEEPIRAFPNVMMVAKGNDGLRLTLNTAIDELLYSGELQDIISKYENSPGLFLRRMKNYSY